MYNKIKKIHKEYKYNKYLMLSVIAMGLGSPLIGGIALYNTLKYGNMLNYFCNEESNMSLRKDIASKRKVCKVLIEVGMFFACLHLFFVLVFIVGSVLTMNDVLNARINA